jgi:uncharacterized protein YjbI with pentapeptide repeats
VHAASLIIILAGSWAAGSALEHASSQVASISIESPNDADTVREPAVGQPARSRGLPKGITSNGTTLNGISFNGTTLNGTTFNGTTLNGTTLNGTTLNGTTLNGTTLNGGTSTGLTNQLRVVRENHTDFLSAIRLDRTSIRLQGVR